MSISEFFSMGGFGLYVWSAFGITLLFLVSEVIYLKQKRKTIILRLQRMIQTNAGDQNESQT